MRLPQSVHPKSSSRQRHGAALVAALVCLLIVTALLGNMLLGALQARRQMRKERDLRQCELLLQAGIDRAAFRLAEQPDYAGETWDLPTTSVIGQGDGQVTIEVARAPDMPTQARVVAEYPLNGEHSIRRSHTLFPQSPMPPAQE